MLNNAVSACHAEQQQKPINNAFAEMNLQHVGVAYAFLKCHSVYCAWETCDPSPYQPPSECCGDVALRLSGPVQSSLLAILWSRPSQRTLSLSRSIQETLLHRIQNTTLYHFDCEQTFLKFLCSAELSIENWDAACSSDLQNQDSNNAIAFGKKLVTEVCQITSEEVSFLKRRCRDLLFRERGYLCLQSRYLAILVINGLIKDMKLLKRSKKSVN